MKVCIKQPAEHQDELTKLAPRTQQSAEFDIQGFSIFDLQRKGREGNHNLLELELDDVMLESISKIGTQEEKA